MSADRMPPPPPRFRSVDPLYEAVERVASAQLEQAEQLGSVAREVAAVREDVRHMRADFAELRRDVSQTRDKLDSVPDMVRDAAESTGRHQVEGLRRELAERERDSAKHRLEKRDARLWAVLIPVMVGIIMSVLGFFGHMLLTK